MTSETLQKGQIAFKPLTRDLWDDVQALFRQMGGVSGCWCMWWRVTRAEFSRQYGEGNRQAFRQMLERGEVPGILAYAAEEPVGWCAVAPRQAFPVLDRSPVLKPVDAEPVWSIVCFFVAEPYRQQGMMEALIRAAIAYAGENGARIVEAYPVIPENSKDPGSQLYTGVYSTFARLGFQEVARRSQIRPIMRYAIEEAVAEGVP